MSKLTPELEALIDGIPDEPVGTSYSVVLRSHLRTVAEAALSLRAESVNAELLGALKGVVRVADRATVEFDAAHEAIARAESAQALDALAEESQRLGLYGQQADVRGVPEAVLQSLLIFWKARALGSFPSDAMLINRHIRELEEAIASSKEQS